MISETELLSLWRLGYTQQQIADILKVKRPVISGMWYRLGLTGNRSITEEQRLQVQKERAERTELYKPEKNAKRRKHTRQSSIDVFEPWAVRKARLARERANAKEVRH